jgi:hypothetical protein
MKRPTPSLWALIFVVSAVVILGLLAVLPLRTESTSFRLDFPATPEQKNSSGCVSSGTSHDFPGGVRLTFSWSSTPVVLENFTIKDPSGNQVYSGRGTSGASSIPIGPGEYEVDWVWCTWNASEVVEFSGSYTHSVPII